MLRIFGTKSRDRSPQWPQSEDPKTKLSRSFQIFPETFHLGIPCEPQKLAESMSPLGLAAVHDLDMLLLIPSIRNGDGSKPCYPGEHQNSSKIDVHPLKMVFIGIDPWPHVYVMLSYVMQCNVMYVMYAM